MQVVLENAGASKSALVLLKEGEMFVEVEAYVAPTGEVTHTNNAISVAVNDLVAPVSILNYVKNSAKYLLIDDISKQKNWRVLQIVERAK